MNSAGLQCRYLADSSSAEMEGVLARVVFDSRAIASAAKGYISTGLSQLDGEPLCEIFSLPGAVTARDQSETWSWAKTDEFILLAIWADESTQGGLQAATEQSYKQLLDICREQGYPFLVKAWNYFADINAVDQDLERYRQFCIGRFDAFVKAGLDEEQFPSACALGHSGGDLLVYALASKTPVQHIENPQQQSAYRYPAQYGPRSPSFARATLLPMGPATRVFVSGTASVVGHLTAHPDNLELQIQVTLENLDYLFRHIAANYPQQEDTEPAFAAEILKVYVRHKADLDLIKTRISQAYPSVATVYVAADICRSDLLLEIDGVWKLVTQD
ncbi:MAG TPA: hypothetical protein VN030_13285 [Cellvibrio sp.]|nr:hypothetical protein [Cellvibrio sp.]